MISDLSVFGFFFHFFSSLLFVCFQPGCFFCHQANSEDVIKATLNFLRPPPKTVKTSKAELVSWPIFSNQVSRSAKENLHDFVFLVCHVTYICGRLWKVVLHHFVQIPQRRLSLRSLQLKVSKPFGNRKNHIREWVPSIGGARQSFGRTCQKNLIYRLKIYRFKPHQVSYTCYLVRGQEPMEGCAIIS